MTDNRRSTGEGDRHRYLRHTRRRDQREWVWPTYGPPWHIIDTSKAETWINWSSLLATIEDVLHVSEALLDTPSGRGRCCPPRRTQGEERWPRVIFRCIEGRLFRHMIRSPTIRISKPMLGTPRLHGRRLWPDGEPVPSRPQRLLVHRQEARPDRRRRSAGEGELRQPVGGRIQTAITGRQSPLVLACALCEAIAVVLRSRPSHASYRAALEAAAKKALRSSRIADRLPSETDHENHQRGAAAWPVTSLNATALLPVPEEVGETDDESGWLIMAREME